MNIVLVDFDHRCTPSRKLQPTIIGIHISAHVHTFIEPRLPGFVMAALRKSHSDPSHLDELDTKQLANLWVLEVTS